MNQAVLQIIKNEIEKIEQSSGFGEVVIKVKNGGGYQIEAKSSILITCQKDALDKVSQIG